MVHEALIRNWARLRIWMREDRDFRTWQESLRQSIQQWEASQRDDEALLRGSLLAVAEERLVAHAAEWSAAEQGFIQQSSDSQRRRQHGETPGDCPQPSDALPNL